MPNNNNDDIINDILNELDRKNKKSGTEQTVRNEPEHEIPQPPHDDEPEIEKTAAVPENYYSGSNTGDVRSEDNHEERSDVKIRYADENPARRPVKKAEENDIPEKKKKKKKKKKRSRLPGVLILTTFIFAVSICLSLVIIAYGKDMLGIGKSDTTHLIVIEDGATIDEIASTLESEGIIKSPEFFKLFSKLSNSDSKYIAGEHFVRPSMAYETIIQELTSVENEQKKSVEITFPEGITLYDAAALLEENGICSIDDFLFYFNAGDMGFPFEEKLSARSSLKFYQMEGYLFPDTYYFYEGMDPQQVCQKIYMNFDSKMTDERYKKMEQLNLTLDELVTFASIVQKEAATTETMTLVASVFWNRLNHPDTFPLLQSDPTKQYAENVIKPHMEVYDQVIIDAYDTYVSTGLPPGPICNPGIEAIDAVLEAFESDYYYFIANVNTGQTYFSATLEEHEEYKALIEQQYEEEAATASDTETETQEEQQ